MSASIARWSSGTISYVHTSEGCDWQERVHRIMLGLRSGILYRMPIGNGGVRLGVWSSLVAGELGKYRSERLRWLPLMGATASYHLAIGR
jgi:thiamine phosphate synthase YjbQ (UPF0047 family)